MRVLIAVHGYPPTFSGGAELRAARTARSLRERGHDVRVLCVESCTEADPHLTFQDSIQDGVLVRRLYFKLPPGLDMFSWNYDNPLTAQALDQLMDNWRPDVLHLFSGYLMSTSVINTAVAHAVPTVVSLTDYWWLCHRINLLRTDGSRCDGPSPAGCARCHREMNRRYRLPARVWPAPVDLVWKLADVIPLLGQRLDLPAHEARIEMTHDVLNKVDAFIAPSQYLADTYVRYGVDPARLHVSQQGVNLDACVLRVASPTLRFGYMGQIKHHKGIHLLVDAWGKLTGTRARSLAIYGSDQGEEHYGYQLRQRSASMADLSWPGSLRHNAVWSALANLDVLVVPSRWAENSPNVILEAQAMGVAIVGTNLGGVAEAVRHERNGLLFAPDDHADLATQLQRILDEPALLKHFQRNLIPFRTTTEEVDKIENLYMSLVAVLEPAPKLYEDAVYAS